MALTPGTLRFAEIASSPAAPPAGYAFLYVKTDNVVYLKDSSGTEVALGTASGITSLTGDVTATGPGAAPATVVMVGGATAANIATATAAVLAAASANTANTLVLRDGFGNFSAGTITAALTGAASANVLKTGDTMTGPLNINSGASNALIVDTDVLVVDGATNRVGIGKTNPTEALDVVGNGAFSGTLSASNVSGTNSGDVTILDTFSVDLTLSGQQLSADVRLTGTTLAIVAGGLKVDTAGITDNEIATGIDAVKLADGSVSNTEFQYINSVTSNVQTQINNKQPLDSTLTSLAAYNTNGLLTQTASDTFTGRTLTAGTGVSILNGDGISGNPTISSTITQYTDEMAQDAVGGILTDTSTIDFTYDDTGNTISAIVVDGSITDVKVASGLDAVKIADGSVSNTEFQYIGNLTSDAQTQISNKQPLDSTLTSLAAYNTNGILTQTAADTFTGRTIVAGAGISVTDGDGVSGNPSIASTITQYTDEMAQDAVGNILTDTSTIDFTYDDAGNTISAIVIDGSITDVKVASGIDAVKIGAGSVSNTEYEYLDGVTSAIQTQLNGKASTTHASTHLPSGSDPLTTAAPLANLSATTTNSAGTAESFSKSDHSHAISTGVVSALIPDQANAAGTSANLARADHIHNVPSGTPVNIGTANFVGAAASFALSDHIHNHGAQTNATHHAVATSGANGFMASTDKVILDAATSSNTASTIVKRDGSGNFSAGTITASLTGTASNNVIRAGDTMTGALILSVVALTDGATINLDASLGNVFTVTLGGNRTLAAPTNPTNGQKITLRVRQDGTGSRTLTFNAIYNFGVDLAGLSLSTSANAFDYFGFSYNSTSAKWDCLAISRGYT